MRSRCRSQWTAEDHQDYQDELEAAYAPGPVSPKSDGSALLADYTPPPPLPNPLQAEIEARYRPGHCIP